MLRVIQIGGVDPTYRAERTEFLLPQREQLSKTLDRLLPYPQSSLLAGMLLGSDEKIPYSLKNDLKTTSTIHLIVVSGQNLTILAGFMMSLVVLLGRKVTLILTMLTVVFYSLLTGLEVPVLRAALMAGLAYTAQIFGKEENGWWALCLVALGMLLFNPNYLLSISFQLSFLATLGVVVVSPVFAEYLKKVPTLLRQDLATTLAAQALVMPILVFNFGQLSLIGIVVNSLILWTVPIIMVVGFIGLVVGLVLPLLGQLVLFIPVVLITYFVDLVKLFSKIPGASLGVGESPWWMWLGYYLMIGGLVWGLRIKKLT